MLSKRSVGQVTLEHTPWPRRGPMAQSPLEPSDTTSQTPRPGLPACVAPLPFSLCHLGGGLGGAAAGARQRQARVTLQKEWVPLLQP